MADGSRPAVPSAEATVYPDGPLVLRGDFELRDETGERLAAGRPIALCRCGKSTVKPFCDGNHKIVAAMRRASSQED